MRGMLLFLFGLSMAAMTALAGQNAGGNEPPAKELRGDGYEVEYQAKPDTDQKIHLELRIVSSTALFLRADGEKLLDGIQEPGPAKSFAAKKDFTVVCPAFDNVALKINGKAVRVINARRLQVDLNVSAEALKN